MAKKLVKQITETALSKIDAKQIVEIAAEGAALLRINLSKSDPRSIVSKIDSYVARIQQGKAKRPADVELEVLLGCLWGEQLVAAFGWRWVTVVFRAAGNVKLLAVVPANRTLAIYPVHYLISCLDEDAPVTLNRAFEILSAKDRIPDLPAYGYENVMDHSS